MTRASGLTAFSPFIRGCYFVAPYRRSAAGYTDAKPAIGQHSHSKPATLDEHTTAIPNGSATEASAVSIGRREGRNAGRERTDPSAIAADATSAPRRCERPENWVTSSERRHQA